MTRFCMKMKKCKERIKLIDIYTIEFDQKNIIDNGKQARESLEFRL